VQDMLQPRKIERRIGSAATALEPPSLSVPTQP
jgi:hypothetical protein